MELSKIARTRACMSTKDLYEKRHSAGYMVQGIKC